MGGRKVRRRWRRGRVIRSSSDGRGTGSRGEKTHPCHVIGCFNAIAGRGSSEREFLDRGRCKDGHSETTRRGEGLKLGSQRRGGRRTPSGEKPPLSVSLWELPCRRRAWRKLGGGRLRRRQLGGLKARGSDLRGGEVGGPLRERSRLFRYRFGSFPVVAEPGESSEEEGAEGGNSEGRYSEVDLRHAGGWRQGGRGKEARREGGLRNRRRRGPRGEAVRYLLAAGTLS